MTTSEGDSEEILIEFMLNLPHWFQNKDGADAVRTLLEKGGLLEKKVRPAEVLGKQKQEKERSAKKKDAAASETSE